MKVFVSSMTDYTTRLFCAEFHSEIYTPEHISLDIIRPSTNLQWEALQTTQEPLLQSSPSWWPK